MKQIIILSIAFVLFSCSTNRQMIIHKTTSNMKVKMNLPENATLLSMDSLATIGSMKAKSMTEESKKYWKGYNYSKFNIFTMWKEDGPYKNVTDEKRATESLLKSDRLLQSKLDTIHGNVFYISALKIHKNIPKTINACTYFGKNTFAISIECKEEDFSEAEMLLMKILESIKVK